jgi:hypothetical protein
MPESASTRSCDEFKRITPRQLADRFTPPVGDYLSDAGR